MRWARAVAGESSPSAFLIGENSSSRATSTVVVAPVSGSASNRKVSNLIPFGASGSTSLPSAATKETRFSARWKGSPCPGPVSRSTNATSMQCTAIEPAHSTRRPSESRHRAISSGRSLYSTTAVRPSTRATTPIRSSGEALCTTIDDISAPASAW